MPFIHRPRWIMTIDDVPLDVGSITINWALGEALTTVADIEIVTPVMTTPALGAVVFLWYGDLDNEERWPVLHGFVQQPIATSDPNRIAVRVNGPLSLLRDIWDGDAGFTGMTGKEVVEQVLSLTDIDFDASKIQDDSLIIGEIQPITVPKGQRKSVIVSEVNRLLGMVLIEYGFDIHRFYVQRIPIVEDIYRTFTRGQDVDFWGNERSIGPLDSIINYWHITGITYECGDLVGDPPKPPCRCTIYANSWGASTPLGFGVRAEQAGESSELIQDQDFAEWIATERIRNSIRPPDILTLVTAFDPDLHVGDVVGVKDDVRGIELTADADITPYLIERIDVSDFTMTMQLSGASELPETYYNSGNEKRCNDALREGPTVAPGFTPPDAWPRIFEDPEPWILCEAPAAPTSCLTDVFANGLGVLGGYDWEITGTIEFTAHTQGLVIGVDDGPNNYTLTLGAQAFYTVLMVSPKLYELAGPGQYAKQEGIITLNNPVSYRLRWTEDTLTLSSYVQFTDDICYEDSVVFASPIGSAVTISTVTGAPTQTSVSLDSACGFGYTIPPGEFLWEADFTDAGATAIYPDQDVHIIFDAGEAVDVQAASITTAVVFTGDTSGPPDTEIVGYLTLTDSSYSHFFGVSGSEGFFSGFNFFGADTNPPTVDNRSVELSGFGSDDGAYTDGSITSFVPETPIKFTLTLMTSTDTISLLLEQGALSWSFDHTDSSDWQNAGIAEDYRYYAIARATGSGPNPTDAGQLNLEGVTDTPL